MSESLTPSTRGSPIQTEIFLLPTLFDNHRLINLGQLISPSWWLPIGVSFRRIHVEVWRQTWHPGSVVVAFIMYRTHCFCYVVSGALRNCSTLVRQNWAFICIVHWHWRKIACFRRNFGQLYSTKFKLVLFRCFNKRVVLAIYELELLLSFLLSSKSCIAWPSS